MRVMLHEEIPKGEKAGEEGRHPDQFCISDSLMGISYVHGPVYF